MLRCFKTTLCRVSITLELSAKLYFFCLYAILYLFKSLDYYICVAKSSFMGRRKARFIENVTIEDISSEGKGIVKKDGKVIFVDKTVTGDVVDIKVYRKKKNFEEAFVTNMIQASSERQEPFCKHFGVCGGCKWQYLSYDKQLHYKQQAVNDAFRRIAKVEIGETLSIVPSENTTYYRNKLEYTFSNKRWLTNEEIAEGNDMLNRNGLGFHIPKHFDKIVDITHCFLQDAPSNAIRLAIKSYADTYNLPYFDIRAQTGLLRNLIIKTSTLGETLVLLSVFSDHEQLIPLMEYIGETFPEITALQYVINPKKNDTIYDLDIVTFRGRDHIFETLGDRRFKIGPKSFFQTNPKQAKRLYDVVKDFANLQSTDNVYDLYTGVGSIALYLADDCKQITGIEQVDAAISDAKANAMLNDIDNAQFYVADVKQLLDEVFIQKHGKPDVIVTDPPRAGMHTDVVQTLLEISAPKIVYVSCNAATQARDIALLSDKYIVAKMCAVDMFPQTTHIENVALLILR